MHFINIVLKIIALIFEKGERKSNVNNMYRAEL